MGFIISKVLLYLLLPPAGLLLLMLAGLILLRWRRNAGRILIAAGVANCLSGSLLFCLAGKFKQPLGKLRTRVHAEMVRNDKGRMRIGRFDVTIHLAEDASTLQHVDRCLAQFEDFCIVTESVRRGIPVGVRVVDAAGKPVFAA